MDKVWCFSQRHNNSEDGNSNNIIFTVKDKIICSCSHVFSKRQLKAIKNSFARDFKDQFIAMNIKQKVSIKIRQRGYIFSPIKLCKS